MELLTYILTGFYVILATWSLVYTYLLLYGNEATLKSHSAEANLVDQAQSLLGKWLEVKLVSHTEI